MIKKVIHQMLILRKIIHSRYLAVLDFPEQAGHERCIFTFFAIAPVEVTIDDIIIINPKNNGSCFKVELAQCLKVTQHFVYPCFCAAERMITRDMPLNIRGHYLFYFVKIIDTISLEKIIYQGNIRMLALHFL